MLPGTQRHDDAWIGLACGGMTSASRLASAESPWLVTSSEPDPPTYLAWPGAGAQVRNGSQPVGVLLAARHFPESAEIHLMAVDPTVHRRGIGRVLVEALEADLIADGVELLQVKTQGPSRPDASYDQTRQFYTRMGFRPLEEISEL
jgi:GNAT superfamily N-acetyltransferase